MNDMTTSTSTSSRPLSSTLTSLVTDAKSAGLKVRREATRLSVASPGGEKVVFPLTETGAIDFSQKRGPSVREARKVLALV